MYETFITTKTLLGMFEEEDYWFEYSSPQEWSEEAIRELVKGILEDEVTEYHWKFVAPKKNY